MVWKPKTRGKVNRLASKAESFQTLGKGTDRDILPWPVFFSQLKGCEEFYFQMLYPPVNEHGNGKSPFYV